MKNFSIEVTENGLAFAKELVASKLAVTIDNVEIVAEFKRAVLNAKPMTPIQDHEPNSND